MLRLTAVHLFCQRTMSRSLKHRLGTDQAKLRFLATSTQSSNVHASLSVKNGIAVINLISPGKVNVLHMDLVNEMKDIISEIENNDGIKGGVLISNKPDCFIAGADINMLAACKTAEEATDLSRQGQTMLQRVEDSKKPIIAAIMGSCLGGGAEVALACHYRIMANHKSTFGFPEVMLGLLPGGGGTQRLPKLTGVPNALDLMLTGRTIRPEKARALGIVDQLVQPLGPGTKPADERTLEYLAEVAVQFAQNIISGKIKINREQKGLLDKAQSVAMNIKFFKDYVFKKAHEKVLEQTQGLYPAPLKILEVVRIGLDQGSQAGYEEEAMGFGSLAVTKESKGLISLFHGQTECKKSKYGKPQRQINTIGVLGAGLMGAGIAQICLENGYKAVLKDTAAAGLSKGVDQIGKGFASAVLKKKITEMEKARLLSNLIPSLNYFNFNEADIVIEAVSEDITVKHQVLREVEDIVPDHCVFATNTSAIPISKIAEVSKRPEKVIGMHYFSPVDKMPLLEIVKTKLTSEETIRTAVDVGLRQRKVPIVVNDGPGFYTTRVILSFVLEIYRLVGEGCEPERLDKLSIQCGFPIGCVVLTDEVGLDVGYHVYLFMLEKFGDKMKTIDPDVGKDFMEAGYFGRKSGKGIYLYDKHSKGAKGKVINPGAMEIINKYREKPKVPNTDENIKMRIISRFVNEAVRCLEEGILSNPLEGDIGAVFGIGFPPFTGGPFHYVDSIGADKLVSEMRKYEEHYGATFTPCQLLVDHGNDRIKKFFPS